MENKKEPITMAINLIKKGERMELGLKNITIDLGWEPNDTPGVDFDLDASAFMIGENGKLPADEYFVFYNNLTSPDGAVASSGDDRDGEEGETLTVHLDKVNPAVTEILFTVTIHEADARRQNFGQVHNSFIKISNTDNGEDILRYDLDEDFSVETAVIFGRLYRRAGVWKFEAIGRGYQGGLEGLVNKYAY